MLDSPAQIAQRIAAHHSNLNAFAAVVILLEGGLVYGNDQYGATSRIIAIAKKAQQQELKRYDKEMVKLHNKILKEVP